jgi:hypothetical protein
MKSFQVRLSSYECRLEEGHIYPWLFGRKRYTVLEYLSFGIRGI